MDRKTVELDGAGRLVLPKAVRKRFNLSAGAKLKVTEDENGIRLEPVQPNGQLVRKGSLLVFRGHFDEPITVDLVNDLINQDRDRNPVEIRAKSPKR